MLRHSKIFFLLSAIALAGCQTTQPGVRVEIQRVEVPIPVPCKVDIPARPDFNFDKLKTEDNLFDKTKSLLADRQLHLGYEDQLLSALKACNK